MLTSNLRLFLKSCRYYVVYLQALKFYLASEFPYPTRQQFIDCCPPDMKRELGGRTPQEILDGMETEIEKASCLLAQRTLWSRYKHKPTCKFLLGISASGCVVTASEPRGGSCDDVTLTTACGALDRLYKDLCSLLDKGSCSLVSHQL